MRYVDYTDREIIVKAISIAERLLRGDSPMMKEIKAKNDWKYNSGSGDNVYINLRKILPPIAVKLYKSRNPWSAAIAYYDGEAIYFNTRKLSNNIVDIVATLVHEYSHHCGFHHNSRNWWGRDTSNYKTEHKCLYSVPYWLSENIERFV